MMKIACIVHVYYPDFWPEIARCLRNIDEPFDLYVTHAADNHVVPEMVRGDFPNAVIVSCENRGFDVWPFVKVLASIDLVKYTHIVKLHTKRNVELNCGRRVQFNHTDFTGPKWREYLLRFVSTPENWARAKRTIEDPYVGMVADRHLPVRRDDTRWQNVRQSFDQAHALVSDWLKSFVPRQADYVCGTMFLARASIFEPLVQQHYAADDFAVSVRDGNEQLAHVLERAFGLLVAGAGYRIAAMNGSLAWRRFAYDTLSIFEKIGHFFWEDVKTPAYRMVKVFCQRIWRSCTVKDSAQALHAADVYVPQCDASIVIAVPRSAHVREMLEHALAQQDVGTYEVLLAVPHAEEAKYRQLVSDMGADAVSRVRIVLTSVATVAAAWNAAIAEAKGLYVMTLSDDFAPLPRFLAHALVAFRNQSNVGIVGGDVRFVSSEAMGKEFIRFGFEPHLKWNQLCCVGVFRKREWIRVGGFDEAFDKGHEDWDFWMKILERGFSVCQLRLFVAEVYARTAPIYGTLSPEDEKRMRMRMFENHKRLYLRFGVFPQECKI